MKVLSADEVDFRPGARVCVYRTRFPIALAFFAPAGILFDVVISVLPGDEHYYWLELLGSLVLLLAIASAVAAVYFWRNARSARWVLYVGSNGIYINPDPFFDPSNARAQGDVIHLELHEVVSAQYLKRRLAINWAKFQPEPNAGNAYVRLEIADNVVPVLSSALGEMTFVPDWKRMVLIPRLHEGRSLILRWKCGDFAVVPGSGPILESFAQYGVRVLEPFVFDHASVPLDLVSIEDTAAARAAPGK